MSEVTLSISWDAISAYRKAGEETMSVTEEAGKVEREIDEIVRSLYGV